MPIDKSNCSGETYRKVDMIFENSKYTHLAALQKICLTQNIPFVSYRLPLETEIISLVQHHSVPEKLTSLNNIDEKVGFIISPFVENDKSGTYFLEPDCVYFSDDIEDIYLQKLSENNRFLQTIKPAVADFKTTSSHEFIENVNKAVEEMRSDKFDKVVLSKIRIERLGENFNVSDFFLKLCSNYPHAFVYLLQLPGVGCWAGATPEPLLVMEDEKVKTVSLAGTQIATDADVKSYQWSSKELHEQDIVTDFVEKTIKNLGVKEYTKEGPDNYQAANLIHLRTAFEFSESQLNGCFGDFLKTLHPTPSVGGLPKKEAREFILSNENHNRSYYTGFLGPVNIDEKTNIFVNLRCLQLFDKEFILYSGAGIITSSIAENEWEETDNKMQTMMNVMK